MSGLLKPSNVGLVGEKDCKLTTCKLFFGKPIDCGTGWTGREMEKLSAASVNGTTLPARGSLKGALEGSGRLSELNGNG
jgi:hypothetical protein